MSNQPEPGLDLENLLLPAWAQHPPDTSRFAQYQGGDEDRGGRGDRPFRGDRRGGPPRREGGFGQRPGGRPGGGPGRPGPGAGPGPGRPGPGPGGVGGPQRREGRDGPARGWQGRGRPEERREPPPPPLDLYVSFVPEEKGVESLARQIRITGRAYPLFDIAQLVLKKAERFVIEVSVRKDPEGKVLQPLWVCSLDETVWLSSDEAVRHVLRKHFDTFYQAERTPTDPPKGTYTFVAQCGLSGVILGPPNYHDYQNKLQKLHSERFSRMPFDMFKAKVRIVRDEAVVKKWIDDQSWKTEYICLNVPEPQRLATREDVERHFRETHSGNILREVERVALNTPASRDQSASQLIGFVRRSLDEQRRFPLKMVTTLSQQFASYGLQFFKVNKTVTHVAVARPRFLDLETTPVSDGVRKIVAHIGAVPACTRRKLMDQLAPTPKLPVPVPAPTPAPDVSAAEGEASPAPVASPAAPVEPELTPEQTAVVGDLHWLIHEGHVIEFANGTLELAKKPLPKPPRPEPKPRIAPTAPAAVPATGEAAPSEGASAVVPVEAGQPALAGDAAVEAPQAEVPAPAVGEAVPAPDAPAVADAPPAEAPVSDVPPAPASNAPV